MVDKPAGTGPYLSIRARISGINHQDVDDAVFERMEILFRRDANNACRIFVD